MFLSVILIVTDRTPAPEPMTRLVWSSMALLIGFVLIAEVDMFLALGLFSGALTLLWGERRVGIVLLVAIVVPLLVFLLFDSVFEIRFPRGLLTDIWYG